MGEKIYYIVQILIFSFLAIYSVTRPQDILKALKKEMKKRCIY